MHRYAVYRLACALLCERELHLHIEILNTRSDDFFGLCDLVPERILLYPLPVLQTRQTKNYFKTEQGREIDDIVKVYMQQYSREARGVDNLISQLRL